MANQKKKHATKEGEISITDFEAEYWGRLVARMECEKILEDLHSANKKILDLELELISKKKEEMGLLLEEKIKSSALKSKELKSEYKNMTAKIADKYKMDKTKIAIDIDGRKIFDMRNKG